MLQWIGHAIVAASIACLGLAIFWFLASFLSWLFIWKRTAGWPWVLVMCLVALVLGRALPPLRLIAYSLIATIRYRLLDRLVVLGLRNPLRHGIRYLHSLTVALGLLCGSVSLLVTVGWPAFFVAVRTDEDHFNSAFRAIIAASPITMFLTIPLLLLGSAVAWHLVDLTRDVRRNARSIQLTRPRSGVPRDTGDACIRVAHLSDLHLTRADDFDTMEHRRLPRWVSTAESESLRPNRALRDLIALYEEPLRTADVALVTGDITDMGLSEEWERFASIVPDWLLQKMVLVPGNHDVNIVPSDRLLDMEPYNQKGRHVRMVRFLLAMDAVSGTRALAWDWDRPITLREKLQPHAACWEGFLRTGHWPAASPITEIFWGELFPIVVPIRDTGFAVAVLDTNTASSSVVTNAFGAISRHQIVRVKNISLPRHLREYAFVIAMHHHVGMPMELDGTVLSKGVQHRFMTFTKSVELVEAAASRGRTVLLHGHRHVLFHGRADVTHKSYTRSMDVCSSASTTLGDEPDKTGPGFLVWEVASSDRETFVSGCQALGTRSFRETAQRRLDGIGLR